jgi:hypothetical protein
LSTTPTPADTGPAVVSGLIRSASSHSLPPPPHASSSSSATATAAPSSSSASSTSTPPAYVPLTSNPADLSTAELMAICESFIDQLRSGSAPWLLQRLNNTYGPIPSDPVLCGYWMASVWPPFSTMLTLKWREQSRACLWTKTNQNAGLRLCRSFQSTNMKSQNCFRSDPPVFGWHSSCTGSSSFGAAGGSQGKSVEAVSEARSGTCFRAEAGAGDGSRRSRPCLSSLRLSSVVGRGDSVEQLS